VFERNWDIQINTFQFNSAVELSEFELKDVEYVIAYFRAVEKRLEIRKIRNCILL